MHLLSRLVLGASLLGLAILGSFVFDPVILEHLGLDIRDWSKHLRLIANEATRRDDLVRRLKISQERLQAQEIIGLQLIARHLTLAQAARLIVELPDEPPLLWHHLRESLPGASDDVLILRFVIDWTCSLVESDHARDSVRQRLEGELQDYLQRGISFRSVEVPSQAAQQVRARFAQE
jgi:hypothetical protein